MEQTVDPLSAVMYSGEIGRVLGKISFEIDGVPPRAELYESWSSSLCDISLNSFSSSYAIYHWILHVAKRKIWRVQSWFMSNCPVSLRRCGVLFQVILLSRETMPEDTRGWLFCFRLDSVARPTVVVKLDRDCVGSTSKRFLNVLSTDHSYLFI